MDVGELRARLLLDTSAYTTALARAGSTLQQFRDGAARSLDHVRSAFQQSAGQVGKFYDALTALPGPLGDIASRLGAVTQAMTGPAGLVAGFTAAAAGTVLLAKSLSDDIERLTNLSRQTGLSIAALQGFEQAAREAGEAPETLAMGFAKVNIAISDFVSGRDEAARGFEAIGVNFKELVRTGADVETILERTAQALAAIPDPTTRAARQMDLFGLRGRAMSTVLDTIARDGIGGYVAGMRNAGIITSDETNKMAAAFDKMLDDMLRKARAFWLEIKAFSLGIVIDTRSDIDRATSMIVENYTALLALVAKVRAAIGLGSQEAAEAAARTAAAAAAMAAAGSQLVTPETAAGVGVHEIVRPGVIRQIPRDVVPDLAEISASLKHIETAMQLGTQSATQYEAALRMFIAQLSTVKQVTPEVTSTLDDMRLKLHELTSARTTAGAGATAEQIGNIYGELADNVIAGTELIAAQQEAKRLEWIERQQDAAHKIAAIFGELAQEQIDQYTHSVETRITLEQRVQAALAQGPEAQKKLLSEQLVDVQQALDTMELSAEKTEELITKRTELASKRRILTFETEADRRAQIYLQEQEATIRLIEFRATLEEREAQNLVRLQVATAMASGDAWGVFTGRFTAEVLSWGTALEQFGALGARTAATIQKGFEDFFFALMQGRLHDLDDIWKAFLDSILRQLASFLAASVVQTFLGFFGGSGGAGGGGVDLSTIISTVGTVLSFFETTLTESTHGPLRLAESTTTAADDVMTFATAIGAGSRAMIDFTHDAAGVADSLGKTAEAAAAAAAAAAAGTAGTGLGSTTPGLGGISFGPSAKTGARIGGALGGFLGIPGMIGGAVLGGILGGLRDQAIKDFMDQVSAARLRFMAAAHELEALDPDLSAFDAAAQDADRATQDATKGMNDMKGSLDGFSNAAQDADRATQDATKDMNDLTGTTGDFGTAVGGLGDAMAGAVDAAQAAAATAEAAAADAEAAAADAHGGEAAPGPGEGGENFQHGGVVRRRTRARLAERFPEVVLGPQNAQAFARDFAAGVASNLDLGDDTDLMRQQNDILRQIRDALRFRGRTWPRGDVLA